eukprot:15339630-Ditylum_brightwellii.AAC.1
MDLYEVHSMMDVFKTSTDLAGYKQDIHLCKLAKGIFGEWHGSGAKRRLKRILIMNFTKV